MRPTRHAALCLALGGLSALAQAEPVSQDFVALTLRTTSDQAQASGFLDGQRLSGSTRPEDLNLQMQVLTAYLNDGTEPKRHPFGAHSYYVPAQLFATADGYLALFITHDGFWRSFAKEAGIDGFATMAERAERRTEVLDLVTAKLATDTAINWEARLRPLGIPAAAVRSLQKPPTITASRC